MAGRMGGKLGGCARDGGGVCGEKARCRSLDQTLISTSGFFCHRISGHEVVLKKSSIYILGVYDSFYIMAFGSIKAPYVCQNCLRSLHHRAGSLQSTQSAFTKQWQARNYRVTRWNAPDKTNRVETVRNMERATLYKKMLALKEEKQGSPLTRSQKKEMFMTYRVKPGIDKIKENEHRRATGRVYGALMDDEEPINEMEEPMKMMDYKESTKMMDHEKPKKEKPVLGINSFTGTPIASNPNQGKAPESERNDLKSGGGRVSRRRFKKHEAYTIEEKVQILREKQDIQGPTASYSPAVAPRPRKMTESKEPHVNMVKVSLDTSIPYSWYWETLAPTFQQRAQANNFFTKQAVHSFLTSVAQFRNFPESNVPEVAFVGRSNVGKSSLMNAIVDQKLLARTSSTPGFTKTMNLYGVATNPGIRLHEPPNGHKKISGNGGLTIVDMPGYGEGSLSEWGVEIMKYVQNRTQLRRVFVLIDSMHGIKEKDKSLLSSLTLSGIPHQVILTKLDRIYIPPAKSVVKRSDGRKLKPKGTERSLSLAMSDIRQKIQPPHGAGALGELLAVSTEMLVDGKMMGIDALRFAVVQAAGLTLGTHGKVRSELVRPV